MRLIRIVAQHRLPLMFPRDITQRKRKGRQKMVIVFIDFILFISK